MSIRSNISKYWGTEYGRLIRKGDQESELGCLALQDNDKTAADEHFRKARNYWQLASMCRVVEQPTRPWPDSEYKKGREFPDRFYVDYVKEPEKP